MHKNIIITSVYLYYQNIYKNSFLGFFWILINPIFTILIYFFVFGFIFQNKVNILSGSEINFGLFICSGFVFWLAFQDMISGSLSMFEEYSVLIKKVNLPIYIIPIITCIKSFIPFLIFYLIYSLILLSEGNVDLIYLFSIPLVIFFMIFMIILAFMIGFISKFFSGFGHFVSFSLSLVFWLTPIIYSKNIIPEKYQYLLNLNPLSNFIGIYRSFIFESENFHIYDFYFLLIEFLIITIFFKYLYKKNYANFLDLQ